MKLLNAKYAIAVFALFILFSCKKSGGTNNPVVSNGKWITLGDTNTFSFNGGIYSIAIDGIGNIYVGGGFSNTNGKYYVAQWNGTSWSEFGGANTSPFNGGIGSIAIDASGNLYAGGGFTDGKGNFYIAEYKQ